MTGEIFDTTSRQPSAQPPDLDNNEILYAAPQDGRLCLNGISFSFSDFFYYQILGEGATAICVACKEKRSMFPVAMKIFSKMKIVKEQKELDLKLEILVQSRLCHPGIVPILTWFDDEERIALVMKYCNQGDLSKYLRGLSKPLNEAAVSRLIFDVLWALRYCHGYGVAHLDLKPENIMVHNGRLLLGDFGISAFTPREVLKFRGTQDYFAPEQTVWDERFGPFSYKVDIWAVGILTYEILCGTPPFGSTMDHKIKSSTLEEAIRSDPWDLQLERTCLSKGIKNVSKEIYSFLDQCLQKNSSNRPTAEVLFEHPFVQTHNFDRLKDPSFQSEPHVRGLKFNADR